LEISLCNSRDVIEAKFSARGYVGALAFFAALMEADDPACVLAEIAPGRFVEGSAWNSRCRNDAGSVAEGRAARSAMAAFDAPSAPTSASEVVDIVVDAGGAGRLRPGRRRALITKFSGGNLP